MGTVEYAKCDEFGERKFDICFDGGGPGEEEWHTYYTKDLHKLKVVSVEPWFNTFMDTEVYNAYIKDFEKNQASTAPKVPLGSPS